MASEEFYRRKEIVQNYDNVRFKGLGGSYVNNKELKAVTDHITPGKKILEAGPGTGRLTEELLKLTSDLTLFDNSEHMLDVLKNKYKKNKIKTVRGNITTKKLDETFEYHVSLRLFIHLTEEELRKALKQIRAMLDRGGIVLFDTLNIWSLYPIINLTKPFKKRFDFPYNHFINNRRMRRIIKESGFEVAETKNIFVIPKFVLRYSKTTTKLLIKLNELLERTLPFFGTHTFWKAIKT